MSLLLAACSIPTRAMNLRPGADYGEEQGRVWVRGPWDAIRPSEDIDEVIDQLCPVIGRLPQARDGDDGLEYCGLLYSRPDGSVHASLPSSLTYDMPGISSRQKSCRVPTEVRSEVGPTSLLADYHSHPWPNSSPSPGDLSERTQRFSIRIQFDSTCRIYKYLPFSGESRPGEVYLRVGKTWRLESIVRTGDKPGGKATPPLQEAL